MIPNLNFRGGIKQACREPLVHFLLAGSAIFAIYSSGEDAVDFESRRIVVGEEQVQRLASMWSRSWQRPPNANELDGLIREYIKEEIYYREAKRLGLDQDDIIVRRRLRSKMEFLATSEVESMAATDAVLQQWLDKHPGRYATDPTISFESVYVTGNAGDAAAHAKARGILSLLKSGSEPATQGDPISLPRSMDAASQSAISRQYGKEFVKELVMLPKGEWSGPVASGFGLHLVRLNGIDVSRKPALSEIRQQVENDWRAATKVQRENSAYQALLDCYDIEIERSE
jgi:peptidyl-prolyl cis-trans isomerase C